jgi:hypothetical protein
MRSHPESSIRERSIAPRVVDVKLGADESHVHWDLLEDARNHTTYKTIQPPLYAGGSGDFILVERESLHALRGFNEVYRLARVGIDVNFLVKAYSSGYRIATSAHRVSHQPRRQLPDLEERGIGETAEAAWGARGWPSREVIYDNSDAWGLRDAPERRIDGQTTWLDFSWDAVPPLVDLRRLVLPAARVGLPTLSEGSV